MAVATLLSLPGACFESILFPKKIPGIPNPIFRAEFPMNLLMQFVQCLIFFYYSFTIKNLVFLQPKLPEPDSVKAVD